MSTSSGHDLKKQVVKQKQATYKNSTLTLNHNYPPEPSGYFNYIHAITQALRSCCLPSSHQRFAKRAPYAAPVRPTGCQFGSWAVGRNQLKVDLALSLSRMERQIGKIGKSKAGQDPLFNIFLDTIFYLFEILDHQPSRVFQPRISGVSKNAMCIRMVLPKAAFRRRIVMPSCPSRDRTSPGDLNWYKLPTFTDIGC